MSDKICAQCKHCIPPSDDEPSKGRDDWLCSFSWVKKLDIVTGEVISPPLKVCRIERSSSGSCGPQGKNWSDKVRTLADGW